MNTLFEQSAENRKDEWLTPPHIIKSLGRFDLDPCSPVNRPWPTADHHFTENDNGLTKEWFGRVWCNPPYSDIASWLKKCVYHGNAVSLVFARTETAAFFRYVWSKADSIFFFSGRLQFYHVTGESSKKNAGAPSVLIAYGKNNVDAIHDSGLPGRHVQLKDHPVIIVGVSPTWIQVVSIAVRQFGDDELKPIYEMVERIAPDKISRNQHWKAKIRQSVQYIRKQQTVQI